MKLSIGAPAPAILQTLTPRAQDLYSLCRWFWNRGKDFKAGREWIATKLKCSVRSISRAIVELAVAGLWSPKRRYRRTNLYEPAPIAQMSLDFGSQEPPQVVEQKKVGTSFGTTVVKPESLKLWRRVVSVPLVVFRIPEHWRKRREEKNAGRNRPSLADLGGDEGLMAFYGYSGGSK